MNKYMQKEVVEYLLKHNVKLEIKKHGYVRLVLNDSVVILFKPWLTWWQRITRKAVTLKPTGWAEKETL